MKFIYIYKLQICWLLLSFSPFFYINSQSNYPLLILRKDTSGVFLFTHQVDKSESLYSIARMYRLPIDDLTRWNQAYLSKILRPGQELRIPLNPQLLSADSISGSIPVRYQVESSDLLYHLSTRICGYPLSTFKAINKLKSDQIRKGQVLLMGYLKPVAAIESPKLDLTESLSNTSMEDTLALEFHKNTNGLALSETKAMGSGRLFVLHNEAEMDSYIELTNPVLNRKVLAKVIGRIPPVYEKNIQVIVSQEVAKLLGAVDHRFFVQLRYN